MSVATDHRPAESSIQRGCPRTQGTVLQRYLAAALDNSVALLLAMATGIAVDRYVDAGNRPLQFSLAVAVYFIYFLIVEGAWSRTPGKMLTGLKVVGRDGSPCTTRQVLIRTLARLIEVNPLLLGALPAAIAIITNKHRQRLGDRVAKTFVVFK